MRVTLVAFSLTAGGAERVLVGMSDHWAAAGHVVTLMTLGDEAHDFYATDPAVRRVRLARMKPSAGPLDAIAENVGRVRALRRTILDSTPDVVISFIERLNVLVLLATRGLGVPVIVSERIDPRHYDVGPLWSGLRRATYPMADRLVVQTRSVSTGWAREIVPASRVVVIPNPVHPEALRPHDAAREPFVLAMGRLDRQKGFDLLLRAFATIAGRHPRWRVVIAGEGPEHGALAALSDQLGLSGRVDLVGRVGTPLDLFRRAGLFVLSSRFEGYPNVLLEAMACGTPSVSFDCPSGPREIIRDGIDGVLVPANEVAALAAAVDRLLGDPLARASLGANGSRAAERFHPDRVMPAWDDLIASVLRGSRSASQANPRSTGAGLVRE